jgi:Spy/CpxP family protein refolding chaperone
MTQELQLSDEQRDKVLQVVHESQERTKLLYSLIGDDVREEMKETREAIRQQLTPDQAKKFEEMLRRRQRMLAMRNEDNEGVAPRPNPEGGLRNQRRPDPPQK